jgi:hypothetical protein
LDWARLSLRQGEMSVLIQAVLCKLEMSSLRFDNLQELEHYVERHFIGEWQMKGEAETVQGAAP